MKTHTQDFKEEIKLLGKQQDIKITYILNDEQIELTSEDINSVTPYYEANLLKSVMKQLDIDSNKSIPEGTEINFKYGLLVNGEYEYLNYGNYIVYSSEKQEDTNSYLITCYDKLINSMKDYEELDITYPVTVREYITKLAEKLGLEFKNAEDEFVNYDKELTQDFFTGIGFTYRDVLDDLAEVTASVICLDNEDKLELRDITTITNSKTVTGETINLTDSLSAYKPTLKLNGQSNQETSQAGKNLIIPLDYSTSVSGVTFEATNGVIHVFGTSTASINTTLPINQINIDGDYYFSTKITGTVASNDSSIRFFDKDKNNFIDNWYTFPTNTQKGFGGNMVGTTGYIYIYVNKEKTVDFYIYPQLETGLTMTEYEPFVPNMPSPDYPSTIETVGSNVNKFDGELSLGSLDTNGSLSSNNTRVTSTNFQEVESNKSYSLSNYDNIDKSNKYYILCQYDEEQALINRNIIANPAGFTTTSNAKYIKFTFYDSTGIDVSNSNKFKLEKGTKTTPYSPYNMGSVEIDVVNKNWLKLINNNITTIGINFSSNLNKINVNGTTTENKTMFNVFDNILLKKGSYVFHFNCENAPPANSCQFILCEEDGTRIVTLNAWGQSQSKIINLEKDTIVSASKSYFYVNKNFTFNNTQYELQIELGEIVSEIVEPQSQTKILPIQEEMLEDDYIADVEYHTWGKIVLTGNETILNSTSVGNNNRIIVQIQGMISVDKAYCNYFKFLKNHTSDTEHFYTSTNQILFFTNLTGIDFKTWLQEKYNLGNPVVVYYKLATPKSLPLTEEQREALDISLYDEVTNISAISSELNPIMELTYAYEEETIDEEYLKDVNVNFGKTFGEINSVVLSRSTSDNIYRKDDESIEQNGLYEIKISDNQIMNNNDRDQYIDGIFNKLKGLSYPICDFTSTRIIYFDLLDRFMVKVGENKYPVVMFNNEQDITQGLQEQIYADKPETSETDYTKADKTDQKINQTNLIVDKQNQTIQAIITQIGDRSEKETSITADIDGLASEVSSIQNVTEEVEENNNVVLESCVEGSLLELHIYGNNTVFDYLYPANDLYPSNTLYPYGDSRIVVTNYPTGSEEGTSIVYELGIKEVLRQNGTTVDEYVLKDGIAQIIRRINTDGTIKTTEEIEELGAYSIPLLEGTNEIEIKNYNAKLKVKYAIQNDFTDIYATKVEMNSKIEQTAEEINLEVRKKVDENEVISKINQSAEQISISANKLNLNGAITANGNFKIDKDGNMECKNAVFNGGNITINNNASTYNNAQLKCNSSDSKSYMSSTTLEIYNNSVTSGVALSIDGIQGGRQILAYAGMESVGIGYGEIDASGNIYAANISSDKRLKENIKDTNINSLEILKRIAIKEFDWKKTKKHINAGFIAQDMEQIDENFVLKKEIKDKDGKIIDYKYYINELPIIATLTKAIQEQQKQIEELKQEIEKLKKGEK